MVAQNKRFYLPDELGIDYINMPKLIDQTPEVFTGEQLTSAPISGNMLLNILKLGIIPYL